MVLTRSQAQLWADLRSRADRLRDRLTFYIQDPDAEFVWILPPYKSWEQTEPSSLRTFPTRFEMYRMVNGVRSARPHLAGCIHPYFIMCDACSFHAGDDEQLHDVRYRKTSRTLCRLWNRDVFLMGKVSGAYGFRREWIGTDIVPGFIPVLPPREELAALPHLPAQEVIEPPLQVPHEPRQDLVVQVKPEVKPELDAFGCDTVGLQLVKVEPVT